MIVDIKYIYNVLILEPWYSDNFSCDISIFHRIITSHMKDKILLIHSKDLVIGNFLVYLEGGTFVIYKVVAIKDENCVIIAHENKKIEVFYKSDENGLLSCRCPSLDQQFFYRISLCDIRLVLENLRDKYYASLEQLKSVIDVVPEGSSISKQVSFKETETEPRPKKSSVLFRLLTCCMFN